MYQPPSPEAVGTFQPGVGPSYAANYVAPETAQDIIDNEQLRLLRIGYFISAAQTAIFIPFGLLYAGMGFLFSHLPGGSSPPPPAMMTWLFGLVGTALTIFASVSAVLKVLTAIRLKERRSRGLCLVTAGLSCLEAPYGTLLGVWTFMVLGRANVRRKFEA